MTSGKMGGGSDRLLTHVLLMTLPLAMLAVGGCASLGKSRARGQAPYPASSGQKSSATAARRASSSLANIVNEQIQHGHYSEGEAALRQFLVAHPADGSAKAILHQLTVDPVQMLGSEADDYTVKAGDSYSSLAARALGDASLFVVLARYNGSRNPSALRVGQTLRLPHASSAGEKVVGGVVAPEPSTREAVLPTAAITDTSAAAKAARLQDESVVMFKQGRKQDALKRLDQALLLQPRLRSNGDMATLMRKQLVAKYHEEAVVLYRDQKLDPAIALWDRVLVIEPGFEPAVIYRTRALELKRRLKQF